ncbi:MAG: Na+/H+ antiporter NhaC family protein [candidate division KSB1 bacterium]|nr:Na+/H+ antiporter NhaC family protein [candidate division KSB1 bacterium]
MNTLEFRGGPGVSIVPLAVFLVATIALVVSGAPAVEGMILAAMLGISAGMALSKNMAEFSETVFSLMANRIATVAIVCWLWAGAFSGILASSGLVEAIVWIGYKLQLTGAGFTLAVFLSAALFAVSVGTGLGTIIGFTAVMYPAGIVLGANPAALLGAIFSGAALGDNLAPISDTTIVSAATQETDVGGVVRSRLKYVLIAAGVASVLFLLFGGGAGALSPEAARNLMQKTADPRGLPMLIPAVLVFLVAVSGRHFLAALTAGIVAALIIGPLTGVFPLASVFHVTAEKTVAGSAVKGMVGLLPTSILTLLLVTLIGIMKAGGFLEKLMAWLDAHVAKSARSTEFAIIGLITLANLCVSVNTVAMVTAGPLANDLRKRHGINPYRCANLLDTISCTFPYILPYAATIVAAEAVQRQVAEQYSFVHIVPWSDISLYFFYGLWLFPFMIFAVYSGFGRGEGFRA